MNGRRHADTPFSASQIGALNFRTGIVNLIANAKGVEISVRLKSMAAVGRQRGRVGAVAAAVFHRRGPFDECRVGGIQLSRSLNGDRPGNELPGPDRCPGALRSVASRHYHIAGMQRS